MSSCPGAIAEPPNEPRFRGSVGRCGSTRIDTIQSIDRVRATLLADRGAVHEVNPFEQARQFAHSVVSRLLGGHVVLIPARNLGIARARVLRELEVGAVVPLLRQRGRPREVVGVFDGDLVA